MYLIPGELISPLPTTFFLPQMSILAALTTIPLFFGFSFSQLSYPSCTSAEFTWVWNYNVLFPPHFPQLTGLSRHITPSIKIHVRWPHIWKLPAIRAVSIWLLCMGIALSSTAVWTFEPLPTGYHYGGPNDYWRTDLCMCNSILYSLVSACDACQGDPWSTYGSISVVLNFILYIYHQMA